MELNKKTNEVEGNSKVAYPAEILAGENVRSQQTPETDHENTIEIGDKSDIIQKPIFRIKHTLRGHHSSIASVKFSPDGSMLATASADKTVKLWNWREGTHIHTFEGHHKGVSDVSWSADSKYLASASDDTTILSWDVEQRKFIRRFSGHTSFVFCVNFNYTGNMLASGSFDETVRLWDFKTGDCMTVLPAHSDPVTAVHFNKDSTMLVSSAYDGLCRIWNSSNGTCLQTIIRADNPPVSFVRFSPNGKFILVGTLDSKLKLWDYESRKCVKTYTGHANEKFCCFAAFGAQYSKDSQEAQKHALVVCGSEEHSVFIWNLNEKYVLQQIHGRKSSEEEGDGHCDVVVAVDCYSQGGVIASGALDKDRTVKIWISEPTD
mmetsp:Transcript_21785/g.30304  ORF Transcript_21785/g.30304 Transcript_21785/m.30304 type:complete len:377 (-) Transcript_21785:237-1367(-)